MWPPLSDETLEEGNVERDNVEEEEEEPWQPPELPILTWPVLQARTGLVYDQQMMGHYNLWDKYVVGGPDRVGRGLSPSSSTKPYMCSPSPSHHPEMPQRISQIMCRLEELGLSRRCLTLPARPATDAELLTCHRSDPHARGGLGSQCMHANWGLDPRNIELLGDVGGEGP